jgi:hypothetical protein
MSREERKPHTSTGQIVVDKNESWTGDVVPFPQTYVFWIKALPLVTPYIVGGSSD